MSDKLSEKALIDRCIERDAACWSEFLQRYSAFLHSIIRKKLLFLNFPHTNEDAEDIAVNTFNSLLENDYSLLKKYDPAYAFRTWLAVLALTQCNRFVRKKKITTASIDAEPAGALNTAANSVRESSDGPELTAEKKEEAGKIRKAVERLNPREKLIVIMLFYDRVKYKDIAKALNIPMNSISKVIFRVKANLKEALKKEGIKDLLS